MAIRASINRSKRIPAAFMLVSLLMAGCSEPEGPRSISVQQWSATPGDRELAVRIVSVGQNLGPGATAASVNVTYGDGCSRVRRLPNFSPSPPTSRSRPGPPKPYDHTVTVDAKVATARLTITLAGDAENGTPETVYDDLKVVDAAEQRKAAKAKCPTDADYSPPSSASKAEPSGGGSSMPPSEAEEMAATMINVAGYLCADITNAYQIGDTLIVDCVEYRSGAGRAKYGIHLKTGSVRRM